MLKEYEKELKKELSVYKVRFMDFVKGSENYVIYSFHKNYRKTEYYDLRRKQVGGVPRLICAFKYVYYSSKKNYWARQTGFYLGLHVFDWGLRFMHVGNIIVNQNAKAGKNTFIYPQVLIGQTHKGCVATIGDNVSICSGSRIIGKVRIGNNTVIAPNAVVTHDVPDNAIMVGIPARILKYRSPDQAR